MANPIKGVMALDVAGEKFDLCLNIDAICAAEQRLDMGFGAIVENVLHRRNVNYRIARELMVSASGGKIDTDLSSEIVSNHIVAVWPQLQQLVMLALPPVVEADDSDPPKAAKEPDPVGIGPSS